MLCVSLFAGLYLFLQDYRQSPSLRLLDEAVKRENRGQLQTAEQLYLKLKDDFSHTEEASKALYRVARIYQYDYQDARQALVYYLQLEKGYPDSRDSHAARQEAARIIKFSLRDYSQAIEFYQRLMSVGQGELDQYLYEIADCYFRLENYSQARIELETLITDYPDSSLIADAMFRRGSLLVLEGKKEQAKTCWEGLIDQYPDSHYRTQVQFNLAKLLEEEDYLLEALEQYEKLKDFPQPAMLNDKIKQLKERIQAKKKAI